MSDRGGQPGPKSISIVIPARDEEQHLPGCLKSIEAARKLISLPVEVVVVLNRCTDRTESIALEHGCRIVREDAKNLSLIRNAGARAAENDILITIDADSTMSERMLRDVVSRMSSGKIVGGGVFMFPERWSAGILASGLMLVPLSLYYGGVSGGLFYCLREDFLAIGGFNEALVSAEDIDFACRLKAHGKRTGRRFSTILSSYIVTSCRKFDRFGDWYLFRKPLTVWRALRGRDQEVANAHWYDTDR